MTKQAEVRVRDMTNHYSWFRHKYGDVRYCKHCGIPLPKSENAPDFYVSQIGDWIEAKNNDATGTWKCSEIFEGGERQNQRRKLQEEAGWLFIELADGNAPKNAGAWLVPWDCWETNIETYLKDQGMKSIRRETTYLKCGKVKRYGADILFADYELRWEPRTGWTIPKNHPYWKRLRDKIEDLTKFLDDIDQKGEVWQAPLI